MEGNNLKKEIGLFMATMLVCGNMIGSGVFMLPATLAQVSGPLATIIAWVLTTIGSVFIAISFAKLGTQMPATGGAYQYTRAAFGDFAGFLSAWLYWNGSWIGNAAIIVSLTSYSVALFPILKNPLAGIAYSSAVLWIFTIINIIGVKKAGQIQSIATVFKIVFFAVFIGFGIYYFDYNNITPLMPEGKGLNTISIAATATLWAFMGMESSTVTAGEIEEPEKNIKRSTILGVIISAIIYILISLASMGTMSNEKLAKSQAPLTDILIGILGEPVAKILSIAVIICILGTTIGWIMSTARICYAAGQDGIFPRFFGKVSQKFQTPVASLIVSGVLVNLLLLMNYQKEMVDTFTFVTLLATLTFLPVYALSAASEIMLLFKNEQTINIKIFMKKSIAPLIAFVYILWAMYGAGAEIVMWGFILMLAGIPMYIYIYHKNKNSNSNMQSNNMQNNMSPEGNNAMQNTSNQQNQSNQNNAMTQNQNTTNANMENSNMNTSGNASGQDNMSGQGMGNQSQNNMNGQGMSNQPQENMNGQGMSNQPQENMNGQGMGNQPQNNMNGQGMNNQAQDNTNDQGMNNQAQDNINDQGMNNQAQNNMNGQGMNNQAQGNMNGQGMSNQPQNNMNGQGMSNQPQENMNGQGMSNQPQENMNGQGMSNQPQENMNTQGMNNQAQDNTNNQGMNNQAQNNMNGQEMSSQGQDNMNGQNMNNQTQGSMNGQSMNNQAQNNMSGQDMNNQMQNTTNSTNGMMNNNTNIQNVQGNANNQNQQQPQMNSNMQQNNMQNGNMSMGNTNESNNQNS